VLVPYSKNHVVARPFGSTLPLSVAEVGVTLVAAPVTTAGAAEVVKSPSAPRLVPAPFVATTR
jgi:hypothetical protein